MSDQTELEQQERDFRQWLDLVAIPRTLFGNYRRHAVEAELRDYHFILSQVPKVYSHVTGGKMSKPMYYASDVKAVHDDEVNDTVHEAFDDAFKEIDLAAFVGEIHKDIPHVKKKALARAVGKAMPWLKAEFEKLV